MYRVEVLPNLLVYIHCYSTGLRGCYTMDGQHYHGDLHLPAYQVIELLEKESRKA